MASSSSRNLSEYKVFISFRGSDVRDGFLSHLYSALKSKQIDAFIDNELERGKDFTENLLQKADRSALSIVIFSKNYPDSEWCLEELEKIHESMKHRNQIVVPVFYEVDPWDVQHLKGNYEIQKPEWKDALVEISNLSGFYSSNSINEAQLIEDIVADVCMKLSEAGIFGIDSSQVTVSVADSGVDSEECLILLASLAVEALSVVFEQLGNALLGFLMAVLGLLICVVEILYRAWTEKVTVDWVGKLPFLVSTYPKYKWFGNTLQWFGLLAAVWQCFQASLGYFYALKKSESPIKMTLTMFLFCFCFIVAKLVNKYTRRPLPGAHTV